MVGGIFEKAGSSLWETHVMAQMCSDFLRVEIKKKLSPPPVNNLLKRKKGEFQQVLASFRRSVCSCNICSCSCYQLCCHLRRFSCVWWLHVIWYTEDHLQSTKIVLQWRKVWSNQQVSVCKFTYPVSFLNIDINSHGFSSYNPVGTLCLWQFCRSLRSNYPTKNMPFFPILSKIRACSTISQIFEIRKLAKKQCLSRHSAKKHLTCRPAKGAKVPVKISRFR